MEKIIVGNLKMNLLTLVERERYFESFKKELKGKKLANSNIVLCPPSVHIESFVKKLKTKAVSIGGQNLFWEERGSYTGEVSAGMLKAVGAEYVIIGHSERRKYFGETNEKINSKIVAACKSGLTVVLCIGENADEKNNGNGESVMTEQLEGCLKEITVAKMDKIIICYEPVWAISSNNPDHLPSANEILTAKLVIKKFLADKFGIKIAEKTKIIYGGSVAPNNVIETCVEPGMDGALVGRESLVPFQLVKIAEMIDKA